MPSAASHSTEAANQARASAPRWSASSDPAPTATSRAPSATLIACAPGCVATSPTQPRVKRAGAATMAAPIAIRPSAMPRAMVRASMLWTVPGARSFGVVVRRAQPSVHLGVDVLRRAQRDPVGDVSGSERAGGDQAFGRGRVVETHAEVHARARRRLHERELALPVEAHVGLARRDDHVVAERGHRREHRVVDRPQRLLRARVLRRDQLVVRRPRQVCAEMQDGAGVARLEAMLGDQELGLLREGPFGHEREPLGDRAAGPLLDLRRHLLRTGHQCRKCRRCVKTMLMPASSAASTTAGSRTEPPGWMTAVTPASIASCGPSGNGKKASEAIAEPMSEEPAARAFSIASRTEFTRLIWPAPIPTDARSFDSTIAFERTCLQTFQANSISPHSASDGLRSVTTSISERSSRSMSRSWISRPPITRLMSRSPTFSRRRSPSWRMRMFGLVASSASASSVYDGAIRTSANCLVSASAKPRSIGPLTQTTPPNADIGSHAKAAW